MSRALSPMSRLLFPGAPLAIARFVVAVIVDAIEGEPERPLAHVREKSFERVAPTIADGDAATAVIAPVLMPGVKAALLHRIPTAIGWRGGAVRRMAMRQSGKILAAKTSAACRMVRQQRNASNECFGSAIAPAGPISVISVAVRKVLHNQSTDATACNIDGCGHRGSSNERQCQEYGRALPALDRLAFVAEERMSVQLGSAERKTQPLTIQQAQSVLARAARNVGRIYSVGLSVGMQSNGLMFIDDLRQCGR